MADIKQGIEYAKKNPNSPFAIELRKRIESGQMDTELSSAGLPTSGSISKTPETKPLGSQIVDKVKQRGENVANLITTEQPGANVLNKGIQATGEAFGAVGDTVDAFASRIPGYQKVKDFIGGIFAKGIDKISDNKYLQDVAQTMTPELEQGLKSFASLGEIANNIIGAKVGETSVVKGLDTTVNVGNKGVDLTKQAANAIVDKTTGLVKPILNKTSDIITPIEPGVENVLNPTKLIPKESLKNISIENIVASAESKMTKLNRYTQQAEKAVNDFSQPTPLAIAGNKADEALNILNNKLAKQGQLKNEALGIVGDKQVGNMQEVRDFFAKEIDDKVGVTLNESGELVDAVGRKSKIAFDPADRKLITDTNKVINDLGDSPTVRELDDTVDALQDLVYKRKSAVAIPVNGQVEGVIKNITGKLNRAVKKVAGEQYTKANSKFAYFVDARDKINKALGAEGVRGASMMKQLFSPAGEGNRRLFEEIKKLTGVDLVEEATLAKFAMENIGDARQASLLEEIIKGQVTGPKSFIEAAATKAISKLQNPVEKAKRIIEKSKTR